MVCVLDGEEVELDVRTKPDVSASIALFIHTPTAI